MIGSYWIHLEKQDVYEIVGIGLSEKDLTPEIEYRRTNIAPSTTKAKRPAGMAKEELVPLVYTSPTFHRAVAEFFDGRFKAYKDWLTIRDLENRLGVE